MEISRGYTDRIIQAFFLTRASYLGGIDNGATGTLPGYWVTTPVVTVGLSDIFTYSPEYKNQPQIIDASLSSAELKEDGTCDVVPKSTLYLGSGKNLWPGVEEEEWTGSARYIGDSHSFNTSIFPQSSAKRIMASFKFKSGCSGLYYSKDGVLGYWRNITITLYYWGTDGVSSSGSVVLLSKQLIFGDYEDVTLSYDIPTGDYNFMYTITFTSTAATKDGDSWFIGEYASFLGAELELGDTVTIYEGALQMIGVGR